MRHAGHNEGLPSDVGRPSSYRAGVRASTRWLSECSLPLVERAKRVETTVRQVMSTHSVRSIGVGNLGCVKFCGQENPCFYAAALSLSVVWSVRAKNAFIAWIGVW